MSVWEQELSEILEQEDKILSRIIEEARLKKDALKNGNIAELDKIVSREQPLVMQLDAAERNRLRLLQKNGFSGKTLGELCRDMHGAYKEKLEQQLGSMSQASLRLKRINDLNAELTRTRLEFYDFLRGAGKAGYEHDGRAKQLEVSSALMDRRI